MKLGKSGYSCENFFFQRWGVEFEEGDELEISMRIQWFVSFCDTLIFIFYIFSISNGFIYRVRLNFCMRKIEE